MGTTTVFATSAAPRNNEEGVKKHSYIDKNGNSGTVADENVKHPERRSMSEFDENQSFLTKEEAAKAEVENAKPREYTEEERKQTIADIESGKIKPFDVGSVPDYATVKIVDNTGKETVLKQSSTVKYGSALDSLK